MRLIGKFFRQQSRRHSWSITDGFALSPQNGAMCPGNGVVGVIEPAVSNFTFASHPEGSSTSRGTPSPIEEG
jgi:hypothetical protein